MTARGHAGPGARRWAALAIAACAVGCATTPSHQVVPEGFAPPGTRVDVELVGEPRFDARYRHTDAGMTAATAQNPVAFLLLLPISLTVDLAIGAANAERQRQARELVDSMASLPGREEFELWVERELVSRLGWEPAGTSAVAANAATDPPQTAESFLAFKVSPVMTIRPDARALLFAFRIETCRSESIYPGSACADDTPLETTIYVHSDELPKPRKDADTRQRLAALIQESYDLGSAQGTERRQLEQERKEALAQLRRNQLSPEEATRLAIDDWTRADGQRLQEAVAAAVGQFAAVVDAMRAHPGEPERMEHSMTRIFSFGGPEVLRERDLYPVLEIEGGRRVLRSRLVPVRSGAYDATANLWFSVPPGQGRGSTAEKALIEFMYSRQAAER